MPYKFNPKKPVHTFRDLEVYQKTMECSVLVVKDLRPKLARLKYPFLENMVNCAMTAPLLLGEAHSLRFGDHQRAILLLERAMADCNKMVIYLEQARGIYGAKLPFELVEDLVKKYADLRGKIFRLEKSWQKFTPNREGFDGGVKRF